MITDEIKKCLRLRGQQLFDSWDKKDQKVYHHIIKWSLNPEAAWRAKKLIADWLKSDTQPVQVQPVEKPKPQPVVEEKIVEEVPVQTEEPQVAVETVKKPKRTKKAEAAEE